MTTLNTHTPLNVSQPQRKMAVFLNITWLWKSLRCLSVLAVAVRARFSEVHEAPRRSAELAITPGLNIEPMEAPPHPVIF